MKTDCTFNYLLCFVAKKYMNILERFNGKYNVLFNNFNGPEFLGSGCTL